MYPVPVHTVQCTLYRTVSLSMDRCICFWDVTNRKPTFSFASLFPRFYRLLPRYLRFYPVTSDFTSLPRYLEKVRCEPEGQFDIFHPKRDRTQRSIDNDMVCATLSYFFGLAHLSVDTAWLIQNRTSNSISMSPRSDTRGKAHYWGCSCNLSVHSVVRLCCPLRRHRNTSVVPL